MSESDVLVYVCDQIPARSFCVFEKMRNRKEFCDLFLQADDEIISAHKLVVFSVIPFLKDLSNSDFCRKEAGTIFVPDIGYSELKSLVEYAYSCKLRIDLQNVRNLLYAACYLRMDDVQDSCCRFLTKQLTPENIVSFRELAYDINYLKLVTIIDDYVLDQFVEITKSESFLDYPLPFLKHLVSQDDLRVENEEQVFEAILRWVKHCPGRRESQLPELLRIIRLNMLQPLYLSHVFENEELIRNSDQCAYLLNEAKNCSLLPENGNNMPIFPNRERKTVRDTISNDSSKSTVIYKMDCQLQLIVQQFDFSQKNLSSKTSEMFYEAGGTFAELSDKLYYFVWGYTIECEPEKNIYKFMSNIPRPRRFATALCCSKKIYIFGGETEWRASDAVDCFDPHLNKWTKLNSMPTGRWSSSVVNLEGLFFVLGGRDLYTVYNCVERYDPGENTWCTVSPMLTRRSYSGAAVLNNKIYVCGGKVPPLETKCATSLCEVYSPIADKWKSIRSMNVMRHSFILLPSGQKLYAMGDGTHFWTSAGSSEIYNPDKDVWVYQRK